MRSLTVHIYIYTFPPRNLLPSLLPVVTSSLSAARPNSPNDEIDYVITEERQERERGKVGNHVTSEPMTNTFDRVINLTGSGPLVVCCHGSIVTDHGINHTTID